MGQMVDILWSDVDQAKSLKHSVPNLDDATSIDSCGDNKSDGFWSSYYRDLCRQACGSEYEDASKV